MSAALRSLPLITAAAMNFTLLSLPDVSSAATVAFKQGFSDPFTGASYQGTEDTTLEALSIQWVGSTANQNYGGRDYISVGRNVNIGFYGPQRSLLRFDVTSMLGAYSTINSVTLRLYPSYVYFFNTGTTNTLAAYSLSAANAGWVEGNALENDIGEAADAGMATWDQKIQGSVNWAGSAGASTAGVDYLATPLATSTYSAGTGLNTPYDFVVTGQAAADLITQWLSPYNGGILLRSGNDTSAWDTNILRFWSSEAANTAYRPELIIDYVASSEVPAPASLLLLLSGLPLMIRSRRPQPRSGNRQK